MQSRAHLVLLFLTVCCIASTSTPAAAQTASRLLIEAIENDDVELVKELFAKHNLSANGGMRGPVPIRRAVELGRLEICKYLIEEQVADVNFQCFGYPVIVDAMPHHDVVALLIEKGADLNRRISFRGSWTGVMVIDSVATPLHFAANRAAPETVKLLMDSGVDVFAKATDEFTEDSKPRQTALDVAAFYGKAENAEAIVTHPKFLAAEQELRQQILDQALREGSFSSGLADEADRPGLLKVLLEAGADPKAADEEGDTSIRTVATAISPFVAEFPQHQEDDAKAYALIEILLAYGGDLDLYSAVALRDLDSVQQLLEQDPNTADALASDHYPALHFAACTRQVSVVKLMLDAGANPDIRNHSTEYRGWLEGTPLHAAIGSESWEIARLLIAAGADVNAKSEGDYTPLHLAVRLDRLETARLLLKNGADVDAKDADGRTPLDVCRSEEMRKLLTGHDAE